VPALSIEFMQFAKGHGTGNDFVILPDPDGRLHLTAETVAWICDRHRGIGGDGILRVVRAAPDQGAEWFMDYRNADGSLAEMCGNGVRVFARYLLEAGLASGPELPIATRAGLRVVQEEPDGEFTVDMEGAVQLGRERLDGLAISVGNPHLACVVDRAVAAFDLAAPRPLRGDEVNVEVVRITGDHELEMRVHERGSGLTLSCGTGAVAAAVAAAVTVGDWRAEVDRPWRVVVPGGRLTVTPSETVSLLTGPAEIVATGELGRGAEPAMATGSPRADCAGQGGRPPEPPRRPDGRVMRGPAGR
jgi:diaminopimelate epimerase